MHKHDIGKQKRVSESIVTFHPVPPNFQKGISDSSLEKLCRDLDEFAIKSNRLPSCTSFAFSELQYLKEVVDSKGSLAQAQSSPSRAPTTSTMLPSVTTNPTLFTPTQPRPGAATRLLPKRIFPVDQITTTEISLQ